MHSTEERSPSSSSLAWIRTIPLCFLSLSFVTFMCFECRLVHWSCTTLEKVVLFLEVWFLVALFLVFFAVSLQSWSSNKSFEWAEGHGPWKHSVPYGCCGSRGQMGFPAPPECWQLLPPAYPLVPGKDTEPHPMHSLRCACVCDCLKGIKGIKWIALWVQLYIGESGL